MRASALLLPTIFLATPLMAQETRFTREMTPGSRLELLNIDGSITVTQGTGKNLTVSVMKTVKKGTGEKVRAIMEEENGKVRICTIDQDRDAGNAICNNSQRASNMTGRDQVAMEYTVTLPAGVTLAATTVNGSVIAKGITKADKLTTVNGEINFTGDAATALTTVNGGVEATLTSARWSGVLHATTVNGSVSVAIPANAEVTVTGQTVSGGVHSDFKEVAAVSKYGPKGLKGMLGKGGRELSLQTVSGSVSLVKR